MTTDLNSSLIRIIGKNTDQVNQEDKASRYDQIVKKIESKRALRKSYVN